MSVALKVSGAACPVVLEEEVEMVCLGVEYLVGEDVYEIAQCHLDFRHGVQADLLARGFHLLHAAVEVGVWLYDVEMCVL